MVDDALNPEKPARFSVRERWLALGVFVVALALRLWVVQSFNAHHPQAATPVIDEAAYDAWARRIAAGDWIGEDVFFQEPLYSYWLGVLYWIGGASLEVARVTQALVGALTALAVLLLTRRLFGPVAGWIASLGFALYRPALWFPTLLLKENLFALAFALLAIAILRAQTSRRPLLAWGGVGALAAIGALLRGNMLVMLPAIALFPVLRARFERRSLAPAAAAACMVFGGALLVLLPVAFRNLAVGGEFVLTTSGAGTNFYGGNNLDNPNGVATEFGFVRTVPEHEAEDWRHEAERRAGKSMTATEVSAFWLRTSLESMAAHTLEHAKILGRKLLLTLGAYEVPDNHFLEWDAQYVAPLRAPLPGFGLLGPLALFGMALVVWRKSRAEAWAVNWPGALEVVALGALYLGTVVLTVTSDRIRFPLVVLLLPFAGFAVARASVWLWRERRANATQIVTGLCACAVALATVFAPIFDAQSRAKDFDERDYNLAVAILRSKTSLGRAEKLANELSARRPRSESLELLHAEIESNRGLALGQMGTQGPIPNAEGRSRAQLDSALGRLAWVLEGGSPIQCFRANGMAGVIFESRGEFARAELHFARALEFDPDDGELLRRRAVCMANAAMLMPAGEGRAQALARALEILESLSAQQADVELSRLIGEIRAAR